MYLTPLFFDLPSILKKILKFFTGKNTFTHPYEGVKAY